MVPKWCEDMLKKFGAYALGTVLLVVVWKIIAQPILDDKKTDTAAITVAVAKLGEAADTIKQAAESAKAVAESNRLLALSLDSAQKQQQVTAQLVERVVDKLLILDGRRPAVP